MEPELLDCPICATGQLCPIEMYTHVLDAHMETVSQLPLVLEKNAIVRIGKQTLVFVDTMEDMCDIFKELVATQLDQC